MYIAISGNGVMGQLVRKALEIDPMLQFGGCIGPGDISSLSELPSIPDGLIDFSHPDCLNEIYNYVLEQTEVGHTIPVVIATTGYSEAQVDQIRELARHVPVVFSSNYSPGVTILTKLLRDLSPLMADWDIEIVETHHNRKLDAPSGTALTLAKALNRPLIYGRQGHSLRKDEIAIHAVRGGDVRGVHEIMFFGAGETLTLKHEALDRGLFAAGAIKAMKFALEQKTPGLWTMEDVMFGQSKV
ncbi:MAG: 4-hydroxy-tetrahydrodipicolinate reductase [Firmicutes bacterium]|nr:4-hydroxy-tetrahydrodipicolinate reductase [Bacillota bacterium]